MRLRLLTTCHPLHAPGELYISTQWRDRISTMPSFTQRCAVGGKSRDAPRPTRTLRRPACGAPSGPVRALQVDAPPGDTSRDAPPPITHDAA